MSPKWIALALLTLTASAEAARADEFTEGHTISAATQALQDYGYKPANMKLGRSLNLGAWIAEFGIDVMSALSKDALQHNGSIYTIDFDNVYGEESDQPRLFKHESCIIVAQPMLDEIGIWGCDGMPWRTAIAKGKFFARNVSRGNQSSANNEVKQTPAESITIIAAAHPTTNIGGTATAPVVEAPFEVHFEASDAR